MDQLHQDWLHCPVTALAFAPADAPLPLLLVGEGSALRIVELRNHATLYKNRVFTQSVLHGIAVQWHRWGPRRLRCLLWGGCALRVLEVCFRDAEQGGGIECRNVSNELILRDRILHATFSPSSWWLEDGITPFVLAPLITAHNEVQLLIATVHGHQWSLSAARYAHGSPTILYSAHSTWQVDSTLLVAAGTVFGDVELWSIRVNQAVRPALVSTQVPNARAFRAHHGSVYGVYIVSTIQSSGAHSPNIVLVTCSDDRTVRAWNLIDRNSVDMPDLTQKAIGQVTGFETPLAEGDNKHPTFSVPIRHLSRVWSVAAVKMSNNEVIMFSSGEDASVQLWQSLSPHIPQPQHGEMPMISLKSIKNHTGRNVWSFDVQKKENDMVSIATGGADGSVVMQTVSLKTSRSPAQDSFDIGRITPSEYEALNFRVVKNLPSNDGQRPTSDCFQAYVLLEQDAIVAITRFGHVLWGTIDPNATDFSRQERLSDGCHLSVRWYRMWWCTDLKHLTSAVRIPGYGAVLVNPQGMIYLWRPQDEKLRQLHHAGERCGNIIHVKKWSSDPNNHAILAPCPEKDLLLLVAWSDHFPLDREGKIILPVSLPKRQVVVTATYLRKVDALIIGTRTGRLLVYQCIPRRTYSDDEDNCGNEKISICDVNFKFSVDDHSRDAITSILDLESNVSEHNHFSLLTTSRDGHVAVLGFGSDEDGLSFPQILHKLKVNALGPRLEGSFVDPVTKDVLIWGFRGSEFVVWNYQKNTDAITVNCGGHSRRWDFIPNEDGRDGGRLIWTQASSCYIYHQDAASHSALLSASHGREVKSIAAWRQTSWSGRCIISTGSEDTLIRIAELTCHRSNRTLEKFELRTRCLISEHLTGVSQLRWSSDGKFLFSAGGAEQLQAWELQRVPVIEVGLLGIGKCPTVSIEKDLRITDFALHEPDSKGINSIVHKSTIGNSDAGRERKFLLATVYSNSLVKVWDVTLSRSVSPASRFHTIATGKYGTCCLTAAEFWCPASGLLLLTASTDGHLAIWRVPQSSEIGAPSNFIPAARHMVHQSAVKALDILPGLVGQSWTVVATGGDDNAVTVSLITLSSTAPSSILFNCTIVPKAHAASITAVVWLTKPDGSPPAPDLLQTRQGWDSYAFLTASNDQVLRIWQFDLCNPKLDDSIEPRFHLHKLQRWRSEIADVSSAAILVGPDDRMKVMIAGVGTELWDVETLIRGTTEACCQGLD